MKTSACILVLAALAAHSSVMAAPTQWTVASGGNGHWYDYVAGTPSWQAALDSAASMTHMGHAGYLATITSAAENDFIHSIPGGQGWVGATDQAVEGTWVWASGPEAGTTFWKDGITLTYANWNSGEPNNVGEEDYVVIRQLPGWNDAPTTYANGYYVEFSSAVPEPGAMALMLAGLAGLVWRVRRTAA